MLNLSGAARRTKWWVPARLEEAIAAMDLHDSGTQSLSTMVRLAVPIQGTLCSGRVVPFLPFDAK